MSSTGPSIRAVCRILNQNSCGSGSICGLWRGGSLILTNAHVAGSKVGRVVTVEVESLGRKRFQGTVIRAAYSNSVSADWALIHVEGLQEVKPVYLSKNLPAQNLSLYTKGFPRCQPHAGTDIAQHRVLNNGVLLWLPDAIGGQSGSGVWSDVDHLQYALLTWSWPDGRRSYGAGQLTAEIYKQNRSAELRGYAKLPGLIELMPNPDIGNLGDESLGDPEIIEGFFSIPLERNIQDFPIWAEDAPVDPVDPEQPINNKLAIEALRRVRDSVDAEIKRFETDTANPIDPNDKDALVETFGL